ncbi:ABC transporter permease [Marinitoga sp. 1135]|uniref:ABC-type dipeptide/oligopeptide/nickel transport system, permease component n=2 Tax=Marinitoga TaxID=160798 RepID=H2J6R5_MARPK|nr:MULTISPECIES: ABC transporter permease subunit [Marinitoga]AEX86346.1 ABC-type dipeptide/oligopeptide/nickel transport system, permease component [Marinitoga piezophila KA3]APT76744.1 ABC transporter permease [Marinitoga sp. 1137]NUU96520.1 ABC transporter permease [Marinitoga sp. 1135]NUU98439.1 ABC transporter permease [Marinitoga sp. 1138]
MNEEIKRSLRKFYRNPSAMLGLILLIFFILVAAFAPLLAPPQIPIDPEIENMESMISQLEEKKDPAIIDDLIASFDDYYEFTYGFYRDYIDDIKNLKSTLKAYQSTKSEKNYNKLIEQLTPLTEDYILDTSYIENIEKNVDKPKELNAAIKDLEKAITSFEKKYDIAIKMSEELDELKTKKSSVDKFLPAVKSYFKKLKKDYIKSLNYDPYIMPIITYESAPVPPSKEHPFGISNGRDIYYGVVWGTRTGFKIGLTVVTIATIIGLFIGSVSAYFGGWVDEILMRITDIFMSVPFMLSAMVLTTILGTGLDKVMIAMIVFGWMGSARLIRGNILQAKNDQYVLAAKALGVPDWKIIIKHILPNTIFPVVIQASMRIGSMVITAAVLSFLGVGAPQGYADWGSILNYARNWILGGSDSALQYWYTVTYPGTAMVLFVLAWNLVGDALRDIFDPKLRG